MVQWRVRLLPALGGLLAAATVVAGCGSHGSRQAAVQAGGPGSGSTPTTVTPTTFTPSTVTPSTVAPSTVAPSTVAAPQLIVRSFDGTISYVGRRPATIGFSGDSTNIVSHLTWTSWGPTTAVGHGLLGLDNCKPNCASGTVTEVLTTIELSDVVSGHFTAMTEKSGSLDRSYSYPSTWASSAS